MRIEDITTRPDGTRGAGRLAGYVRDRRVPLEMCPTSNAHTGAVSSIEEHPIDLLRRLRFRVTVNTDNRLMSGITLSSEFSTLAAAHGLDLDDLEWLTLNAMKSAFGRSTAGCGSSMSRSSPASRGCGLNRPRRRSRPPDLEDAAASVYSQSTAYLRLAPMEIAA